MFLSAKAANAPARHDQRTILAGAIGPNESGTTEEVPMKGNEIGLDNSRRRSQRL